MMRWVMSGYCLSHVPTAKTVIGAEWRLVKSSICRARLGSPEPWKVNATWLRSRGPVYTPCAGLVCWVVVVVACVGGVPPAGVVVDADPTTRCTDFEQAARPAAAAARNVRLES